MLSQIRDTSDSKQEESGNGSVSSRITDLKQAKLKPLKACGVGVGGAPTGSWPGFARLLCRLGTPAQWQKQKSTVCLCLESSITRSTESFAERSRNDGQISLRGSGLKGNSGCNMCI